MSESWLVRDGIDRERMLDMDRRICSNRIASLFVLATCLVLSGAWVGWWPLIPLTVAGAIFKLAGDRSGSAVRPEYYLFGGWLASELMIGTSVALSGGVESPALAWFAIPIVTLSARFSLHGVVAGVIAAGLLMVGICLAVNTSAVIADPPKLMCALALLVSTAILSTALMQSDVKHRTDAVLDPLTGLLNRSALRSRSIELAQRSALTAEPIGVIVADIDHFKRINDVHGHAAGDVVLKAVAETLVDKLRAFDLAYRIGGEEFLLLLPGADLQATSDVARALHESVRGIRGGQPVTLSFGVSASRLGEAFDYERVFECADAALYRAKNNGRDRVCVASMTDRRGDAFEIAALRPFHRAG